MCGICGVFLYRSGDCVDREILKGMTNILSHRGPDDNGYYMDKNIGLGHRRLSIIDLSKKGKQPMCNEDKTVWIVFNGEIYNFKDIKCDLEKKHRFVSDTDTEVIVHAYEEWGEACLSKIDGMFAFAIWDDNKKKLFLARDRFGKKPLYYYNDNKKFVFASEIKSILEYPDIERKINYQALSDFLGLGYTPLSSTMFEGILKLPPSRYLVLNNGVSQVKRYWGITIRKKVFGDKKLVEKLFKEAVGKRLMSDVPLGAFLSGGIDSSAIVAFMSDIMKSPVKTFCVGFNHPTDELKYADLVAKKFNTDHKEIVVDYDAFKILPKVVWHLDEPLSDPAVLPTYIMSKETKKYVSVVLCGEGGDEVFLGYKRYKQMLLLKSVSKMPLVGKKRFLPKTASLISNVLGNRQRRYADFVSEVLPILGDDVRLYGKLHHFAFEKEEKLPVLMNPRSVDLGREYKLIHDCFVSKRSMIDKMTSFDFKVWLSDDILMKLDKSTMAHALEARAPFLDSKLVEYSLNLVPEQRMGKLIFKDMLKGVLPDKILDRHKHGFNLPVSSWFGKKDIRSVSEDLFVYLDREGLFKQNDLSGILKQYKKYRHDQQLWNIIILGYWYKAFIDH